MPSLWSSPSIIAEVVEAVTSTETVTSAETVASTETEDATETTDASETTPCLASLISLTQPCSNVMTL